MDEPLTDSKNSTVGRFKIEHVKDHRTMKNTREDSGCVEYETDKDGSNPIIINQSASKNPSLETGTESSMFDIATSSLSIKSFSSSEYTNSTISEFSQDTTECKCSDKELLKNMYTRFVKLDLILAESQCKNEFLVKQLDQKVLECRRLKGQLIGESLMKANVGGCDNNERPPSKLPLCGYTSKNVKLKQLKDNVLLLQDELNEIDCDLCSKEREIFKLKRNNEINKILTIKYIGIEELLGKALNDNRIFKSELKCNKIKYDKQKRIDLKKINQFENMKKDLLYRNLNLEKELKIKEKAYDTRLNDLITDSEKQHQVIVDLEKVNRNMKEEIERFQCRDQENIKRENIELSGYNKSDTQRNNQQISELKIENSELKMRIDDFMNSDTRNSTFPQEIYPHNMTIPHDTKGIETLKEDVIISDVTECQLSVSNASGDVECVAESGTNKTFESTRNTTSTDTLEYITDGESEEIIEKQEHFNSDILPAN